MLLTHKASALHFVLVRKKSAQPVNLTSFVWEDIASVGKTGVNLKKLKRRLDMRVYLDNCCYNRPYDDQSQLRISLESQAKLHVQGMIKDGEIQLASSYMLMYENSKNRSETKRRAIEQFVANNTSVYIDETHAETIAATGVKSADAIHTACAILTKSDYLLTTDDRLLKYKNDNIMIVNPTEFIRLIGGTNDE